MTKYAGAGAASRASGISYWAIVGRMRAHGATVEEAVAMGPARDYKPTTGPITRSDVAMAAGVSYQRITQVMQRHDLTAVQAGAYVILRRQASDPQRPRDDVDDVADETGLKRAYVMLRIRKMLARGVKTREEALRMIRERIKAPPGPGQCAACYSKAHDLDGCTTLRAAWLRVHPEEIPR